MRVETKKLKECLKKLNLFRYSERYHPTFLNILIEVKKNSFTLTVQSPTGYLKVNCSTTLSDKEFSFLVNQKDFTELISKIKDKEISIDVVDETIKIELNNQTVFNLHTSDDVISFPEIEKAKFENYIEMKGEDFQELVKQTYFATSQAKTRYDLDNIQIEIKADGVKFVATDGVRLAICKKPCNLFGNIEGNKVVPASVLEKMSKVVKIEKSETVVIGFSESRVYLQTEDSLASIRLTDAKFPSYERVIPDDLIDLCEVEGKVLSENLQLLFSKDELKTERVEIVFSDFNICLVKNEKTNITLNMYRSNFNLSIVFSPALLLDYLKLNPGRIKVKGKDDQTVLSFTNESGGYFLCIPIKITKIKEQSSE